MSAKIESDRNCMAIVVVKKTVRYSNVYSTTTDTSRNVFMKSGVMGGATVYRLAVFD